MFLEVEKHTDRSNTWRNVLFIFGVFIFGGLFIVSQMGEPSPAAPVVEAVLGEFIEQDVSSQGDIIAEPPAPPGPTQPELIGVPFDDSQMSARILFVKDGETGAALYGKNEYTEHPMASITKLMSALVLLERPISWDASAVVPKDAIIDTHMYAGDTYTMEDVWIAALAGSSNKAVLALIDANDWDRDAFVARMNQKAVELGMAQTRFADPTGLSEQNISTASDITQLLEEALQSSDIRRGLQKNEYNIYSKERGKAHHFWNTNWLRLGWVPHEFQDTVEGKTGFIDASLYNFAMQVKDEASRPITVVVLGAQGHEDRFTEARDLAAWAFENYQWPDEWSAEAEVETL